MEFENDSMSKATQIRSQGFDPRVPAIFPRYTYPDKFGGNDNRGNVARIRLLNVTKGAMSRGSAFERKILQEIGGADSSGMASFLLQSINMQDSEKSMVMQTFGDESAVYFLGRSPRMMSISGVLIDDGISNWFYKFMVAYDKFLRGTKVARNFRMIALELPNAIATGVIMDMTYNQSATNDSVINFSFNFLVKNYEPISAISGEGSTDNEFSTKEKTVLLSEIKTLSIADIASSTAVMSNSDVGDLLEGVNVSFGGGRGFIDIETKNSVGDNYANIRMSDGSAYQTTYEQFASKKIKLKATGDEAKKSAFRLKAEKVYTTSVAKVKQGLSFVKKWLGKLESAIKDVTSFFEGIASKVRGFADALNATVRVIMAPITAIMNAVNSLVDSVKSIVAAVMSIRDAVLRPLFQLKQDFNMMKANFKNMIGVVLSLPQSLSAKVSGLIGLAKFENGACLGSLSSGVSSEEAIAVLFLTNSTSVESLGEIKKDNGGQRDEEAVYAL